MRILLLFLLAGLAAADDAAQRLAARAMGETPMIEDLRELCDRVGGRPTGSPAASRAVEWAVKKFKDAGVSATTESFKIPNLWLPGTAEAFVVEPAFSI